MMNWQDLLTTSRTSFKKAPPNYGNYTRLDFESDYQRVILSASFRRLQDKTQVFPLDKNDFIRTRLTHSIEVSHFAKSLGSQVGNEIIRLKLDSHFKSTNVKELADLLSCAGLLHDMGNPPFGHFGESAIRQWFNENLSKLEFNGTPLTSFLKEQMINDLYNFEGNAQVLRLVTRLHQMFKSTPGMNLTCGTVSTLIKYPISSLEMNSELPFSKKIGYFYSERETFEKIIERTGTENHRHPATYLLEAADDISYLLADLEDGLKKQLLSIADLKNMLKLNCIEYSNRLPTSKKDEFLIFQQWVTMEVRKKLLNAAKNAFIDNYQQIMEGSLEKPLLKCASPEDQNVVNSLGALCKNHIFSNKSIQTIELSGKRIIYSLLDIFIPAVIYYGQEDKMDSFNKDEHKRIISLLSENYVDNYLEQCNIEKEKGSPKDDVEKLYLRLLMVTDNICGMTDSYAKALYQDLYGIS